MLGRVECCDSLFEGVYRPDEWTKPTLSKPELQLGKRRAIGFDDEKDGPRVSGRNSRWFSDTDERTARADQCC